MYSVDLNLLNVALCMGLLFTPIRSIEDAFFKMQVAVDGNCDEHLLSTTTRVIGIVLNKTDSEIQRCSNTCYPISQLTNCKDKIIKALCLFTEADAKTIAHRDEITRILGGDIAQNDRVDQKFHNLSTYAICSTFEYISNQTGSKEAQTGGGPGTGAIVGGTVGGLAGLAGAIAAGWGILRKLKKNQVDDTASTGDTTPITPGGIDIGEAPNSSPPAGV